MESSLFNKYASRLAVVEGKDPKSLSQTGLQSLISQSTFNLIQILKIPDILFKIQSNRHQFISLLLRAPKQQQQLIRMVFLYQQEVSGKGSIKANISNTAFQMLIWLSSKEEFKNAIIENILSCQIKQTQLKKIKLNFFNKTNNQVVAYKNVLTYAFEFLDYQDHLSQLQIERFELFIARMFLNVKYHFMIFLSQHPKSIIKLIKSKRIYLINNLLYSKEDFNLPELKKKNVELFNRLETILISESYYFRSDIIRKIYYFIKNQKNITELLKLFSILQEIILHLIGFSGTSKTTNLLLLRQVLNQQYTQILYQIFYQHNNQPQITSAIVLLLQTFLRDYDTLENLMTQINDSEILISSNTVQIIKQMFGNRFKRIIQNCMDKHRQLIETTILPFLLTQPKRLAQLKMTVQQMNLFSIMAALNYFDFFNNNSSRYIEINYKFIESLFLHLLFNNNTFEKNGNAMKMFILVALHDKQIFYQIITNQGLVQKMIFYLLERYQEKNLFTCEISQIAVEMTIVSYRTLTYTFIDQCYNWGQFAFLYGFGFRNPQAANFNFNLYLKDVYTILKRRVVSRLLLSGSLLGINPEQINAKFPQLTQRQQVQFRQKQQNLIKKNKQKQDKPVIKYQEESKIDQNDKALKELRVQIKQFETYSNLNYQMKTDQNTEQLKYQQIKKLISNISRYKKIQTVIKNQLGILDLELVEQKIFDQDKPLRIKNRWTYIINQYDQWFNYIRGPIQAIKKKKLLYHNIVWYQTQKKQNQGQLGQQKNMGSQNLASNEQSKEKEQSKLNVIQSKNEQQKPNEMESRNEQQKPNEMESKNEQEKPNEMESKNEQQKPNEMESKNEQQKPNEMEQKNEQQKPNEMESKNEQEKPNEMESKNEQQKPNEMEQKNEQEKPNEMESKNEQQKPNEMESKNEQQKPNEMESKNEQENESNK